jgi:hypothetical protein
MRSRKVRGSLPASIEIRSSARIGREVFVRASGWSASEFIDRSMAIVRSPNKAPEPTTGTVTPRATPLFNSDARPADARVAPVPVVAHL